MDKSAEQEPSLSERVASSFTDLAAAASNLNEVSDGLGKFIDSMNSSIQKLNIGIEAWVDIGTGGTDESGDYEKHLVGYAKISGHWGITLKLVEGNHNYPDGGTYEVWHFNEAPRTMRLHAIEKLPDLLDRLVVKTETTAKKIKNKTEQARELASAMKKAADAIVVPKKK